MLRTAFLGDTSSPLSVVTLSSIFGAGYYEEDSDFSSGWLLSFYVPPFLFVIVSENSVFFARYLSSPSRTFMEKNSRNSDTVLNSNLSRSCLAR